jgi:transglutaminase-like putative cysteine protease
MRILTVRHVTTYHYSEPVGIGDHHMMFRPRASHDLRLVRSTLDIRPQPHTIRWIHDVFDNSLAVASFDSRTTELRFESIVTIEHYETARPEYQLNAEAQNFPFVYSHMDRPDLERGLKRRHPSTDVAEWAAKFLNVGSLTGTMGLLRSMTRAIREEFTYKRRNEAGVQTPSETLTRTSGTCRDFALLMIEAVRSLGIAARFVSGYIAVPDDRPSQMLGGGATHAWLQAYLPGAGWVDFDPTNNLVGNRNLIRVAVAWEPAHVLPLSGSYCGPASAFRNMDVSVRVFDETNDFTAAKEYQT